MTALLPLFSLTFIVFTLLLFVRAALHKTSDFLEYQGFVADYQLVPETWVKTIALVSVAAEVSVIVLLLIEVTRPTGLVLAAALLLCYGIAMAINIHRGHTRIECGCGGTPQLLGRSLLWRNLALSVIALLPLLALPVALTTGEIAIGMLAALFMLLLYFLFEQANANLMAMFAKVP